MRRPSASRSLAAVGLAVLGLVAAAGCDEAEPAEAGALLLGTIDTHHFCDTAEVVEVRLRAHWQACAEGEEGCEAPPHPRAEGDRYTCPATDATHELGVSLTHPGRYRVEAVAVPTAGEPRLECFVDPETGDTRIELPRDRLWSQSPVVLDEHGACPP
jgi:hypothetical protein